jgi:hypothetical protein
MIANLSRSSSSSTAPRITARRESAVHARSGLVAVCAAAFLGSHASATLVGHYDAASWHAAAGAVTTVDTSTLPLGVLPQNPQPWAHLGFTLGSVAFAGVTAGSQIGDYETAATLDEVWGVAPSTVVLKRDRDNFMVFFDQPTKAFSLEIGNVGGIGFEVVFAGGGRETIFLPDWPIDYVLDPVFYGVTSDREIINIGVLVGDPWPGDYQTSYTKNFAWGTPIPAPAAGAVALLGLAPLAATRRRRCGAARRGVDC